MFKGGSQQKTGGVGRTSGAGAFRGSRQLHWAAMTVRRIALASLAVAAGGVNALNYKALNLGETEWPGNHRPPEATHASGISDAGRVVGYFMPDPQGIYFRHSHGAVWDDKGVFLYNGGYFGRGISDSGVYWVGQSRSYDPDVADYTAKYGIVCNLASQSGRGCQPLHDPWDWTLGDSDAHGVNNAGQVVGVFEGQATLWTGLARTTLGTGVAFDINNGGQIVGQSGSSIEPPRATLWDGGNPIDLGPGTATAINDRGWIVGQVDHRATSWRNGLANDLGTLGGSVSKANDINRSGQVVGWSLTAGDREARATLWNGTGAVDLNALLDSAVVNEGWLLVDAAGINDRGWIVADAKNTRSGQYSAFLLSPVPEPGNLVLMLVGSAALVIVARRRRCRHLRSRGQATQLQRFADSPRSTIPQWADPMT